MAPRPGSRVIRCPYCLKMFAGTSVFRRHLSDCWPYHRKGNSTKQPSRGAIL